MKENDKQNDVFIELKNDNDVQLDRGLISEEPDIFVSGMNVSSEVQERIESEIRQMIHEEVSKIEKQRSQSKSEESQVNGEGRIEICLAGLNLPRESRIHLENEIKNKIESVAKNGPGLRSDATCICSVSYPGRRYYTLTPRYFPFVIAAYFQEDTLRIVVNDGRRYNLSPTEMMIGLRTRGNMWGKEISGWDACNRRKLTRVVTQDSNRGPYWMRINRPICNDGVYTIVFTKQKWWGLWVDMYHLESQAFWRDFGGREVEFEWVTQ